MSTELGQRAEQTAARHLQSLGMKIIDRNWRNRWCEIDIVATDRDKVVHFVEVKYRRWSNFGSGFDYITTDKANRLRRAAGVWMAHSGRNGDFQIDVIAVAGDLGNASVDYLPNAVMG
ncbi:MAG TPA: YraN family protein [Candidatus Saccharimonadales bacterium]|nr:YraN family protein [Candidatus Saccharimonadales bacterium]